MQSSEDTMSRRDYSYPNISAEPQFWVHNRHFGAALWPADVFADGTRKEDVRAAIQAAWLAGNTALCAEIAQRYGVLGRVCLRCAAGCVPPMAPGAKRPDTLLFHLCEMCTENEQRLAHSIVTSVPAICEAQKALNAANPDEAPLPIDGRLGMRTITRLWGKR